MMMMMIHFSCSEFYRMDVWQEVTLDFIISCCFVLYCDPLGECALVWRCTGYKHTTL